MTDIITKVSIWGQVVPIGWGSEGQEVVYLTQAEYDALPASKLTDGKIYKVKTTGVVPGGSTNASDVEYDNTTSGLTADNVQDAIDEIKNNSEQSVDMKWDILLVAEPFNTASVRKGSSDTKWYVLVRSDTHSQTIVNTLWRPVININREFDTVNTWTIYNWILYVWWFHYGGGNYYYGKYNLTTSEKQTYTPFDNAYANGILWITNDIIYVQWKSSWAIINTVKKLDLNFNYIWDVDWFDYNNLPTFIYKWNFIFQDWNNLIFKDDEWNTTKTVSNVWTIDFIYNDKMYRTIWGVSYAIAII